MKRELLSLLCCPKCSGELLESEGCGGAPDIESGTLRCIECNRTYPIENYVPRFVPTVNYSENFGFQWKQFSQTQLDSRSGTSISRDRFHRTTGWSAGELQGALVLDAGCGSGRFAEIALACGANVIAVDYSVAIDVCQANLGLNPRFHGIQGDIRNLPFRAGVFRYIYSLGVLQHTPDPHGGFAVLPRHLAPGGEIAVDVYRLSWRCLFRPKYWLRPVTRHMPPATLFRLVKATVPLLLPISRAISRIPILGKHLRHLIPVANYEGILPLSETQLSEWGVLDTFDMLSPAYDRPQTTRTVRSWFQEAGLSLIKTSESFVVACQGRKPNKPFPAGS